jgi:enoyl-CoA hydratase/carnithine racemase
MREKIMSWDAFPDTPLPQSYGHFRQLKVRRHAGVLLLGLNRPDKRNAIGVETTLDLVQAMRAVHHDPHVKVLVIHGHGEHFSAGMDMKDFFDHTERDPQVLRSARAATDEWRARLMRELPQVRIAAVDGYCLGGALPLLECADIVLATPRASFGLPEINFGFVPGGPIAKSARSALGVRGSSYAALTGRPFDAQQALRWGLVSQIVSAETLSSTTLALAQDIATQEQRPS